MSTDCLYTVIENISGDYLEAPYVPPRGRQRLAPGEQVAIFGNQFAGMDHRGQMREKIAAALESHLAEGKIEIKKTPSPILEDAADERPKVLALNGASVDGIDPCWISPVSDSE